MEPTSTTDSLATPTRSAGWGALRSLGVAARRVLLGGATLVLSGVAFVTALGAPESAPFVLGLLMLAGAALEAINTFAAGDKHRRNAWYLSSAISAATGALLLAWGDLIYWVMAVVLGVGWIVDGAGKLLAVAAGGTKRDSSRAALGFDGVVNLLIGLCVAVGWPVSGARAVFIAVGLRLLAAGWAILLDRRAGVDVNAHAAGHADEHLGLPLSPQIAAMRAEIEEDERHRWAVERKWLVMLLVTFFAIHVGRMETEWNLVGLISPAVAVVGDVVFALFFAYVLIVPARMVWRFVTRPPERYLWQRRLARNATDGSGGWRDRLIDAWLSRRMRVSIELDRAWRSPTAALRRGLQLGLLPTAVLIALAPLLGVSWYFNTESYATAGWEHWAAHRTEDWRTEMTTAVVKDSAATAGDALDNLFAVHPEGVNDARDFSFVVIGDTGEGDASQHVLRDGFLALGARPDVKFLVVASDVIYPQGAMSDYEAKFYLPFKGFSKPIYAIPGNHDWYDALEAFAANFFDPRSARTAMRARREADQRLTSTTESRIDRMIAEAGRLRSAYGVRNGTQHAPFFEIQTDRFALIAVDSGILRRLDDEQMKWLKAALERARGKFKIVIPGHPFYAGGHYVPWDEEDPYREVHALCRAHGVDLVMAGDTHDFEYYREPYQRDDQARSMLHIVNGGGGAYISIGTALAFPDTPPTPDCGFYPRTDAVIAKLDAEVPVWKRPLWWWVKELDAWPSSPEVLAAAFASNRAPFHQSFVEVRVEGSADRVRLIVHGADGPLRRRQLQVAASTASPPVRPDEDVVEFVLPMPPIDAAPATQRGTERRDPEKQR